MRSDSGEGPVTLGPVSVSAHWVYGDGVWTVGGSPDDFERLPGLRVGSRTSLKVGAGPAVDVSFRGLVTTESGQVVLHFAALRP